MLPADKISFRQGKNCGPGLFKEFGLDNKTDLAFVQRGLSIILAEQIGQISFRLWFFPGECRFHPAHTGFDPAGHNYPAAFARKTL